ncbi:MAG: hypothetical protein ACK5P7_04260 [Bdellovibrio sp.]
MKKPKLLFLFMVFALPTSCVSKPVVTDGITAKEKISDNLVVFPLLHTASGKTLARYDFRTHKLDELQNLSTDMSLEDVSIDKDIFLLKDKAESRVTAFSAELGKVVFQKQFDSPGKRIGAVRVSPDKTTFAFAWRPKGSDVEDDLVIVRIPQGIIQTIPAVTKKEVSDLFWSADGVAIYTATYDSKDRETHWVKTNTKSLERQLNTIQPKAYFHPYFSRETADCKFRLGVTEDGSGSTKQVRSIDKIEADKRTTVIRFASGLESHPHGSNYRLWPTSSCRTALLRVHDVLYAIDLENRRIAEISTAFAGTADIIPTKTKN